MTTVERAAPTTTAASRTERVCFQLQVRPERIAEYRQRHAAVWPEMLAALHASGWRNYSLFLRDDGLLIGYVEVDDFAAAQAAMVATQVNARWQTEMSQYFDPGPDRPDRPDTGLVRLEQVFHLEELDTTSQGENS